MGAVAALPALGALGSTAAAGAGAAGSALGSAASGIGSGVGALGSSIGSGLCSVGSAGAAELFGNLTSAGLAGQGLSPGQAARAAKCAKSMTVHTLARNRRRSPWRSKPDCKSAYENSRINPDSSVGGSGRSCLQRSAGDSWRGLQRYTALLRLLTGASAVKRCSRSGSPPKTEPLRELVPRPLIVASAPRPTCAKAWLISVISRLLLQHPLQPGCALEQASRSGAPNVARGDTLAAGGPRQLRGAAEAPAFVPGGRFYVNCCAVPIRSDNAWSPKTSRVT
jgi:hypothetical protein